MALAPPPSPKFPEEIIKHLTKRGFPKKDLSMSISDLSWSEAKALLESKYIYKEWLAHITDTLIEKCKTRVQFRDTFIFTADNTEQRRKWILKYIEFIEKQTKKPDISSESDFFQSLNDDIFNHEDLIDTYLELCSKDIEALEALHMTCCIEAFENKILLAWRKAQLYQKEGKKKANKKVSDIVIRNMGKEGLKADKKLDSLRSNLMALYFMEKNTYLKYKLRQMIHFTYHEIEIYCFQLRMHDEHLDKMNRRIRY